MKLHTNILLFLYNENLLGSDFKVVCKKLIKHFQISPKKLKDELSFLEKTKRIAFANGKIIKGVKAPRNIDDKSQIISSEEVRKTAIGTIVKQDDNYFFKSLQDGQVYYLVCTENVKHNVGKRVCCELDTFDSNAVATLK